MRNETSFTCSRLILLRLPSFFLHLVEYSDGIQYIHVILQVCRCGKFSVDVLSVRDRGWLQSLSNLLAQLHRVSVKRVRRKVNVGDDDASCLTNGLRIRFTGCLSFGAPLAFCKTVSRFVRLCEKHNVANCSPFIRLCEFACKYADCVTTLVNEWRQIKMGFRRVEGVNPTGLGASKKRKAATPSTITEFFGSHNPYKKDDPAQQRFLEDLVLYISKSYMTLSSVENPWLRRLVMRQCGRVTFPSRRQLVDDVIPSMVSKTMERYVLPSLASCMTASASFDLWMSRAGFDTFALVINFIDESWIPCHITVGLFEAHDIAGAVMARQVKELLASFNLIDKIVAYVKEIANLRALTAALTSVVSCVPLQLEHPYEGACFGHAMSKACQHATNDTKVCVGMREVSVKDAQAALQKTITWTKKSGKGRQEWAKACIDAGLRPRKLKTPVKTRFASKVVLFQETLEYRDAINLYYGRQSLELQSRVPNPQTWAVAKAITETLNPIVHQCIMNQSRGYWLLSDALVAALSLCVKMQQDYAQRANMNPPLQLGDFDSELEILCARMQAEVVSVLHQFLSFAVSFIPDKAHNMLSIMLDPRHKGLKLISHYVGRERAVQLVAEYNNRVVIPLFTSVFKYLNLGRYENLPPEIMPLENSLFGSIASNEEATTGLLKSELSMFRRLLVDSDECKCVLGWWKAHQVQFPNVAFLAR